MMLLDFGHIRQMGRRSPGRSGRPPSLCYSAAFRSKELFMRKSGFATFGRVLLFTCLIFLNISNKNVWAQSGLSLDLRDKIDKAAQDVLNQTGVPSASVAVVKDGEIAYLQAYGSARLEPKTAAKPEMRYSIGSISKQFTASAMLLLQEDGKVSLDDKVSKFLPNLTRANEVSIRQLLSHTSGYQDY